MLPCGEIENIDKENGIGIQVYFHANDALATDSNRHLYYRALTIDSEVVTYIHIGK